jgi:hypothetical protein
MRYDLMVLCLFLSIQTVFAQSSASTQWSMPNLSKNTLQNINVDDLIASTPYQVQMDDPELVNELSGEETLGQLQQLEFQRESLSVGKAIALSLIPGGGWGLLYARKRAQSFVPIITSLVGYTVGMLYASGQLDQKASDVCVYQPTNTIQKDIEVCSYYDAKLHLDKYLALDTNDGTGKTYYDTRNDYTIQTKGTNYDGSAFGLQMIIGTYIATSVLGAVWATIEVNEHNDEVRKKVESTAELKYKFVPTVQYNGSGAQMGFGFQF